MEMETTLRVYFDYLWDEGRRRFYQLTDDEKEILSGYILKEEPDYLQYEAFLEADTNVTLPILVSKFLITSGQDSKSDILDHITKMMRVYYKDRIEQMFEDRAEIQDKLDHLTNQERFHVSFEEMRELIL